MHDASKRSMQNTEKKNRQMALKLRQASKVRHKDQKLTRAGKAQLNLPLQNCLNNLLKFMAFNRLALKEMSVNLFSTCPSPRLGEDLLPIPFH